MNKNFEEEYRKMMDSDIPNLWDRIEAQLPPQNVSANEAPAKPLSFLRKNAAVLIPAAAALCLLFILPLFPRQESPKGDPNSIPCEDIGSQTPQSQTAQAETAGSIMDDAVANEACESWDNDFEDGYFAEDAPQQTTNSSLPENTTNLDESSPALLNILILSELKRETTFVWYLAEDLQNGGELILYFSVPPAAETAAASPSVCPGQSYAVLLGSPTAYFSDTNGGFSDSSDGTLAYPVSKWSPLEKNP